ncbi:MAG: hypothetical protein K0S86_91 [Geminicoccaceae bacterium]|jgi:hypothetical protein|nr:hypothetical protein [Geminicoccaceae bacterium]
MMLDWNAYHSTILIAWRRVLDATWANALGAE